MTACKSPLGVDHSRSTARQCVAIRSASPAHFSMFVIGWPFFAPDGVCPTGNGMLFLGLGGFLQPADGWSGPDGAADRRVIAIEKPGDLCVRPAERPKAAVCSLSGGIVEATALPRQQERDVDAVCVGYGRQQLKGAITGGHAAITSSSASRRSTRKTALRIVAGVFPTRTAISLIDMPARRIS